MYEACNIARIGSQFSTRSLPRYLVKGNSITEKAGGPTMHSVHACVLKVLSFSSVDNSSDAPLGMQPLLVITCDASRVQTEGWEAWTRLIFKGNNSGDLVWRGVGEHPPLQFACVVGLSSSSKSILP